MVELGQVLRASTEGFTCGARTQNITHEFGAFVRTESQSENPEITVVGVVTAIRVDDDPLVRQLIMANSMNNYPAAIRDQRENRMVPVEVDVVNVGFATASGEVIQALPPRPPFSLDRVLLCANEEVVAFSVKMDFLRLILNARGVNSAELVAAVLRQAANVRPEGERMDYLVHAGRELTTLLGNDLARLQYVLGLIRPQRFV